MQEEIAFLLPLILYPGMSGYYNIFQSTVSYFFNKDETKFMFMTSIEFIIITLVRNYTKRVGYETVCNWKMSCIINQYLDLLFNIKGLLSRHEDKSKEYLLNINKNTNVYSLSQISYIDNKFWQLGTL